MKPRRPRQLTFDPVAREPGASVMEYLEGFDARTVLVMEMRFAEGLSIDTIAERLGLSNRATGQIIRRTLDTLRETLTRGD